jgi:hypothetical protein
MSIAKQGWACRRPIYLDSCLSLNKDGLAGGQLSLCLSIAEQRRSCRRPHIHAVCLSLNKDLLVGDEMPHIMSITEQRQSCEKPKALDSHLYSKEDPSVSRQKRLIHICTQKKSLLSVARNACFMSVVESRGIRFNLSRMHLTLAVSCAAGGRRE